MKKEHLAKADFLRSLRDLSQSLYQLGDATSSDPSRKLLLAKVEGFIDAGLLINVATRDEMQAVIDRCHYEQFGESRAERRQRTDNSEGEIPNIVNWDILTPLPMNEKKRRVDTMLSLALP